MHTRVRAYVCRMFAFHLIARVTPSFDTQHDSEFYWSMMSRTSFTFMVLKFV